MNGLMFLFKRFLYTISMKRTLKWVNACLPFNRLVVSLVNPRLSSGKLMLAFPIHKILHRAQYIILASLIDRSSPLTLQRWREVVESCPSALGGGYPAIG
jgi:hypothetical protein